MVALEPVAPHLERIDSVALRMEREIVELEGCMPKPCIPRRPVGALLASFDVSPSSLLLFSDDLEYPEFDEFPDRGGSCEFLLDGEELYVEFLSVNDSPAGSPPVPTATVSSATLIVVPEPAGLVCHLSAAMAIGVLAGHRRSKRARPF